MQTGLLCRCRDGPKATKAGRTVERQKRLYAKYAGATAAPQSCKPICIIPLCTGKRYSYRFLSPNSIISRTSIPPPSIRPSALGPLSVSSRRRIKDSPPQRSPGGGRENPVAPVSPPDAEEKRAHGKGRGAGPTRGRCCSAPAAGRGGREDEPEKCRRRGEVPAGGGGHGSSREVHRRIVLRSSSSSPSPRTSRSPLPRDPCWRGSAEVGTTCCSRWVSLR
jgi:hypothetical protein